MKYFYSILLNYKKWHFNTFIIFVLLFVIFFMISRSWARREGFKSKSKEVTLNVILKDTTTVTTDPSPNGVFNVYTYIKKESDMQELIIPYKTSKTAEVDMALPFDASALITVLKIEPKDTKTDTPHKADMFPEKFKLDITMDKNSQKYILSKESGTDAGNNTIKPSTDLSGNELTIVKNGPILDDKAAQIGTAYKGDANPLNPTSKNPYILNIVLKDAKNISRINIEYKLPDKPIDISGAIAAKT